MDGCHRTVERILVGGKEHDLMKYHTIVCDVEELDTKNKIE